MRLPRSARIVGTGLTRPGKLNRDTSELIAEALNSGLKASSLKVGDLDGLVAVPSLAHPRFMEAHFLATKMGLLPSRGPKDLICRTIDTGGAGPITGLLEAKRMILTENCSAVAVVAGDAVSSLNSKTFLHRADHGVSPPEDREDLRLPSPMIPHGYSRYTKWHLNNSSIKRDQLAKVSVLMSRQACRHPLALTKTPHTLDQVMNSPNVAPSINLLECARRADGAGCLILCSSSFLEKKVILDKGNEGKGDVVVAAGGESSGPLYPPSIDAISESFFSVDRAAAMAYAEANVSSAEIDWFGLYDCFPICFLRALEAVGLASKGRGGEYIDRMYSLTSNKNYKANEFPVNTHGGLLGFGAPWEVPAIYNVIEAVAQLTNQAGAQRQVDGAKRALVYGNGGIFSASAVAILSNVAPSGELPRVKL